MRSETARREIESLDYYLQNHTNDYSEESHTAMMMAIDALSSSEKPNKWIPVSERLPDNTDPVYITWVNHEPESYYADIKDKPFTATGHYCNGRWWWYSVTCQDYLDEYGRCDVDAMDDAIEVIAWMPLPEPYKAESEDKDADKKCTYKETGCGSCKRQLDCPIEADTTESEVSDADCD